MSHVCNMPRREKSPFALLYQICTRAIKDAHASFCQIELEQPKMRMQGVLRTKETIDRFKSVPPVQGQTSPLLVYFGTLLGRGKLNAYESVELALLVLSQNKKHLLDNWLRDVSIVFTSTPPSIQ